jgi:hypothetical protein
MGDRLIDVKLLRRSESSWRVVAQDSIGWDHFMEEKI